MSLYNGAGYHSMWGFTPSLNLLQYCRSRDPSSLNDPIRILLLHPSDPRHLIKTIADRLGKDENDRRPIHFYVMEPIAEILARHLLLLHICFDWGKTPISKRAGEFLEIFGNALLSKRSEDYLESCASILHELVCDGHYSSNREMKELFDFSYLKQRDRDELAQIFRSWTLSDPYNVVSFRDERMRSYYGSRYDCRENVIDWDYHTSVKTVAGIVHQNEFLHWRMTGVGFQFGDKTYSVSNKTNATFINGAITKGHERGLVKPIQGYWLDILIGPYICFGIASDQNDKRSDLLFQVINKGTGAEQHRHNASEVSLYNIISLMWALEKGEQYEMTQDHDIFSGLGHETVIGDSSSRTIADVKILPLKGVDLDEIIKKTRHENFFDHVYFSQHMAHQIESRYLSTLLTKRGTFSVEAPMYIFPLSRAVKEQWHAKVNGIAAAKGFYQVFDLDQSSTNTAGTICFASLEKCE